MKTNATFSFDISIVEKLNDIVKSRNTTKSQVITELIEKFWADEKMNGRLGR